MNLLPKQKLRVSIVIPVYNEADSLAACLSALEDQTVKPHEVIVVDNNSSDASVEVAKEFPFVTVLHEYRQGVVHARNRGFNYATGDIIGRIDADTIVSEDWVLTLQQIFNDQSIDAVSGSVYYYDFPFKHTAYRADLFFRARLARQLDDQVFLYGANMGIRREAWHEVRHTMCNLKNMHEDFDLAIHLQRSDKKVTFAESLYAGVSMRRFDCSFKDFLHYVKMSPYTYALHNAKGRHHMYPVIAIVVAHYLPIRIMYKGYDPITKSFSWAKLFAVTTARVDPTINVQ